MEKILLTISLLLFLAAIGTAVYIRQSLIVYTTQILDCLDSIGKGVGQGILKKDFDFYKDLETLPAKIQMKVYQLSHEERVSRKLTPGALVIPLTHKINFPFPH